MAAGPDDSFDDYRFIETPEADGLEQAITVDPDDGPGLDAPERATAESIAALTEANPADVWEQNLPVPDDEDGYDRA